MIMTVNTGYGYLKDSEGHIVSAYELPIGEHPLSDGYTYMEVGTKEEMESVEIYKKPLTTEEETELLIIAKMDEVLRKLAVDELTAEGKI